MASSGKQQSLDQNFKVGPSAKRRTYIVQFVCHQIVTRQEHYRISYSLFDCDLVIEIYQFILFVFRKVVS